MDTLHIRGFWTLDRVAIAHLAALAPMLLAALYQQGAVLLPGLAVAIVVTFFWQIVFARLRQAPVGWDGLVTAIVFIVLLPANISVPKIALALTFGVVMGEQIFGGRGRTFVSPAAVGLAFLFFSFPAEASGSASSLLGAATIPGAAVLLALGLASWRVMAGAVSGLALAAYVAGVDPSQVVTASSAFVVALVFLGCDPVSSSATDPGRLIYGFLTGILTIGLGSGGTAENATAVFAVLLASIFAPLIDQGVLWAHFQRMSRRRA